MEDEFIDIHHTARELELAIARFKGEPDISERNKEIVLSFLRDAALGKTVIKRAKKKIGPSRRMNYLKHLKPFIVYVKKDLDMVTQVDVERFIEALENDQIRSQACRVNGEIRTPAGSLLSPGYKVDIKVTVKKFYKWLLGNNTTYPPLVAWIDTFLPMTTVSTLSDMEIERMIDGSRNACQRAVIQMLFDGGFRLGELLNIRLKHLQLIAPDSEHPMNRCFLARVPYSKTTPRTVALPMQATTKWLLLWLEQHPAQLRISRDGTIESNDLNVQLFPHSETTVRCMVRRAGERALRKRVYPHLLRHASATYWSNRLPQYRLCKRFGWAMASKMPQRYIDRSGIDELEYAREYQRSEQAASIGQAADAEPAPVGLKLWRHDMPA